MSPKQFIAYILFLSAGYCHQVGAWILSRRELGQQILSSWLLSQTVSDAKEGFKYNERWTGTNLRLLTIEEAAKLEEWPFGRWPDPILRRPASLVSDSYFGTPTLQRVCEILKKTSHSNKAVGLAAQQCGVDARIVVLERQLLPTLTLVNPIIVGRSEERDMKAWVERCLVLPPTFSGTVLRDFRVDIEYQDVYGMWHTARLYDELARAAQHELDHDRGILILDHVSLDEMENGVMREIERDGHVDRMKLAYSRTIAKPDVAPQGR